MDCAAGCVVGGVNLPLSVSLSLPGDLFSALIFIDPVARAH